MQMIESVKPGELHRPFCKMFEKLRSPPTISILVRQSIYKSTLCHYEKFLFRRATSRHCFEIGSSQSRQEQSSHKAGEKTLVAWYLG